MKDFHSKVHGWANDRGILKNSNSRNQFLKLMEEMGELAESINKNKSPIDDIGDCMVVLSIIASMEGLTLEECAEHAWNEIKDRTGYLTESGIFIKDR